MIEYCTICYVSEIATVCDMKYDPSQPAQVMLAFHHDGDDEPIVWTIGRELFKESLIKGPSGEGEVLFYSNDETVVAMFISPHGTGRAVFQRAAVEDFIDQVYKLVPEGTDVYDMSDETLQNWLDSFA